MAVPESIERMAQELAKEFSLSAEDRDAIAQLAARMVAGISLLDELPLETVEPPSIYAPGPSLPEPSKP